MKLLRRYHLIHLILFAVIGLLMSFPGLLMAGNSIVKVVSRDIK